MAESSLKMDMSGWLTVAPRLESVNRPAAFPPCCKKFKLMWHSGHVGARLARWFMPLISSRGHFKWKRREFANFTARRRGETVGEERGREREKKKDLARFSALFGGEAKTHKFSSCREHGRKLPVVARRLWSEADRRANKTANTNGGEFMLLPCE